MHARLAALVVLAGAPVAAPAAAADVVWKTGVRSAVSTAPLLPAACDREAVAAFPTLVVDPADGRRLTATWTTDGIRGVGAARSSDGGRT